MFQDLSTLVVDIGTQRSRIGYGGDDAPKLMPYSYVNSYSSEMQEEGKSQYKIGDKYLTMGGQDHDIQSIFTKKGVEGYQYDYEKLQQFIEHNLQSQLGVNLKNYSVLLSQDVAAKPQEAKEIRQKMVEFFFQRLNVANVFFLKAPVLSCFATGRSTAIVVDSGQNFTRSVAIHEGFCLLKSARVAAYGGKNISKELENYLEIKHARKLNNKYMINGKRYKSSFLQFHQSELLSDIKESLSTRKQEEGGQQQITSIEYELPDKQVINIDRKQFKQGFLRGDQSSNYKGISNMTLETLNNCDVDVKKELYSNILMTGGNMLYGSYIQDFLSSISDSAPPNVKVKPVSVCWSQQRKYLSWIGGSIVTSLSSFQSYWIGKQEWKQLGPAIIDKKCS